MTQQEFAQDWLAFLLQPHFKTIPYSETAVTRAFYAYMNYDADFSCEQDRWIIFGSFE